MTPKHLPQDNLVSFIQKYARPPSDLAQQVEQTVLGRSIGLNGYTTIAQAQALGDVLRLTSESSLLDIGAGRGWPGRHLAQISGCRLVSTDIPLEALRATQAWLNLEESPTNISLAAADGRALPFRACSFEAIVHADVFC